MFLFIFRTLFVVVGGSIGFYVVDYFGENYLEGNFLLLGEISGFVLLGLIGYFVAGFIGNKILKDIKVAAHNVGKIPGNNLIIGAAGLVFGMVLGLLMSIAVKPIPMIGPFLPVAVTIIFSYAGVISALKYKTVAVSILRLDERGKDNRKEIMLEADGDGKYFSISRPKILDTSCIIDGRVSDVATTGFLEGKFIIPGFVVNELQEIADSEESIKRMRGRTGLDILQKIQDNKKINAEILEKDYSELKDVDSKLIRLSKELEGVIVTTDFNLNKVARLKGAEALNINDLSTAVKMTVLPGERMKVEVVKEGKEKDQGVAYLSDGTMIVVEGGKSLVGQEVGVLITGVLQTPAGRMIFSKVSDVVN